MDAYSNRPPHQHRPTGPALSRLQLAAALIEYDNDEDDPRSDRFRSHRDSAMFLPFMSPAPSLPTKSRPASHHPYNDEHHASRRPVGERESRDVRMWDSATMEILEGRKRVSEDEDQEPDLQPSSDPNLDVSRWDLPEHLISQAEDARPTNADPVRPTSRPSSTTTPSVRPASRQFPVVRPSSSYTTHQSTFQSHAEPDTDEYGVAAALESVQRVKRLVEVGGDGGMQQEAERERVRTRSGGDLGLRERRTTRVSFSDLDVYDRPSTSMGLMPTSPRSAMTSRPSLDRASRSSMGPTTNPVFIPLPTSPSRSRQSSTYLPAIPVVPDVGDEEHDEVDPLDPNPFAMPAPPPELGSRFDPKQLESQRSQSALSRRVPDRTSQVPNRSNVMYDLDRNPSSHRPTLNMLSDDEQDITEHLARSPYDPGFDETMKREMKVYDEIPTFEEYGKPLMPARYSTNRPKRLSRHDLLRPKSLVMPQSLANIPPPPSPPKKKWEIAPDGFQIGAEKPLPAGARTSVLTIGGVARIPLSLSQRTFRSSLMVGGEGRDAAWVGGAEEDGEVGVGKKERDEMGEEVLERRPGKLYGKSLMDQLEARKQAMKGKQRQFTGDNRPAMMARASVGPSATTSPTAARGPGPLLQFDEHGNVHESHSPTKSESPHKRQSLAPPSRPVDRLTKSTSVFGVDEIWEKEMAKLRIIQENGRVEKAREEERVRVKEEAKAAKKNKGKKKKKADGAYEALAQGDEDVETDPAFDRDQHHDPTELVVEGFSPIKRTGDLPPMVTFSPEKPPVRPTQAVHAPSDDDEPVRRSFTSQRRQSRDSDSEDDVPLSRLRRSTSDRYDTPGLDKPAASASESSDDEDADIPLSQLRKPKFASTSAPTKKPSSPEKPVLSLDTDFEPADDSHTLGSLGLKLPAIDKTMADLTQPSISQPTGGEEEDDDVPLLLRQAHIKATSPANAEDDDDVPLGLRQSMRQSSSTFTPFQPPHPGAFMPPYGHAPASVYGYQPQQPSWPSPYHPQHQSMGYPFGHMPMGQPSPMGMPHHMNMTMPPLPNFSMMSLPIPMMDGSGQVQVQHDNIDSWRKGVAPPSVSGESRG